MRQNSGYQGADFLLQSSYYFIYSLFISFLILVLFPSSLPYFCKNISINISISSAFYLLYCKMRQNSGYQGADFLLQSSYYFKYSLFVLLELFLCYSPLLCLIFAKYIYKYWDYISILSVILQNAAKFGVSRRRLFTPILVLFLIFLFLCYWSYSCVIPLFFALFLQKYIYKYSDFISILSVILQNAAKFGVS
jgi:hypothetical protein